MSSEFDPRDQDDVVHGFISPYTELNAGLWSLFVGASLFLGLRIWCKLTRRHGLWYDDYILIVSWIILLANNSLIVYQFGNGYILKDSSEKWDDRMHILINISSCGTLVGQALTKTAFGVTLLRLSNRWQQYVLWFCISTMNLYMIIKVIFQWARVCGKSSYDNYYRLNFCLNSTFRDDFKEGGNVYNIIMDFIFATFPWLITRHLEMRRVEKVGLCVTMSLGMIVAIVAAIRVSWKDDGNERDAWYIYRNGLSQVWYSSEITGTIMVQCVPILRTFLKEIHTSFTSKKLASTADARSTTLGSKFSSKRASGGADSDLAKKGADLIVLKEIPEEDPTISWDRPRSRSPSLEPDPEHGMKPSPSAPSEHWPLPRSPRSPMGASHSGRSLDSEREVGTHSFINFDDESDGVVGLSPPPYRRA